MTTAGGGAAAATEAGVTVRGAGACGGVGRAAGAGLATTGGATEAAGAGGGVATTGRAATGGVTTATAGRGGVATVGRPSCSAWRRSRIARAISPGLDAREKSTFCRASACWAAVRWDVRPPLMWPRTFSASSSSMDELCVFFSVTPTAVSASRMLLLLTSSSRARSLMRTLLNQPSSHACASSCS